MDLKIVTILLLFIMCLGNRCCSQVNNLHQDSSLFVDFKRPIAGQTWYIPKYDVEWLGLNFGDMTASEFAESKYFEGKTKESFTFGFGRPIKENEKALYFRFFPKNAIPNPDCPLYIVFLFDDEGIYTGFDIESGRKEY